MLERLTSRKFLVIVAALIGAIQAREWGAVVSLALGYAGAQGWIDLKAAQATEEELNEDGD